MTGAWCTQALIHDIPMERRSINANPAPLPSSREKPWPWRKVIPTPDPRLSFSPNPTIHPALLHPSCLVSTAFAFSSHIKPLSLSFALFLSPQPPRVTLSHVSLPSFNTLFASNTSRWLATWSRCAKGQALKTVRPSKHCVLFELFCQRGYFSRWGKKKANCNGGELRWGGNRLGRWHVEWCSGS